MKKNKNNIHGIMLLDKPTGISSNKALQIVKHRFDAKKAGHTGSLDPLASGLLPICFGQATKISEYLLHSHKRYQTVIKLGEVTDTLDSEGEVTQRSDVQVTDGQIEQALVQFRGQIKQIPPMYSALKKDGQPLYKLARKGEVIERPARDMTVFELTAQRLDNLHVKLRVHCSSGFYIRSLAHDLGRALGCGAHVVELRRTHIKATSVQVAHSLEKIEQGQLADFLLPIDTLLEDLPKVEINRQQQTCLLHGKTTDAQDLDAQGLSRIYGVDKQLFAIGEVTKEGHIKTMKKFITD
ncbi:MAG: tRNA pseudouridine(55) synthase TruB [Acidiferrobacterales bacterium]|nr:tRNA pseudouridine(55) synthase TruB [Acidiferrobacterales bacterium]